MLGYIYNIAGILLYPLLFALFILLTYKAIAPNKKQKKELEDASKIPLNEK